VTSLTPPDPNHQPVVCHVGTGSPRLAAFTPRVSELRCAHCGEQWPCPPEVARRDGNTPPRLRGHW